MRHRLSIVTTLLTTALIAPTLGSVALAQAEQVPVLGTKQENGHTRGVSVLVTALDTNKDGALSADEIAAATKSLLQLDHNLDGTLSGPEFHPTLRPVQSPTAEILGRLMEFDKNGDGKLAKTEVPEQMSSLFVQVDANHDGTLDKAELTAFVEKRQKETRPKEQAGRSSEAGERATIQTSGKDTFVHLGGNQEVKQAGNRAGNPGLTRRLSRILVALDTNKDLQLSAEEIANAPTSLKVLDVNSNGKIDAEEFSAAGTTEFVSPEVKKELQKESAKPASPTHL